LATDDGNSGKNTLERVNALKKHRTAKFIGINLVLEKKGKRQASLILNFLCPEYGWAPY